MIQVVDSCKNMHFSQRLLYHDIHSGVDRESKLVVEKFIYLFKYQFYVNYFQILTKAPWLEATLKTAEMINQ